MNRNSFGRHHIALKGFIWLQVTAWPNATKRFLSKHKFAAMLPKVSIKANDAPPLSIPSG